MSFHDDCYTSLEDAELAKEPDPCQHVVMPVRFVDEEPKPAKPCPCRSHECAVHAIEQEDRLAIEQMVQEAFDEWREAAAGAVSNMESVPIDPAIQARVSKILDDKEAMYRQSDLMWRSGFAAGMVFTTAFGFFVFVAGYVIACLV